MELKTLKDLGIGLDSTEILENIKQETIKWFKEDKKVLKMINPTQHRIFDGLTNLWMKRLDITEEDLK